MAILRAAWLWLQLVGGALAAVAILWLAAQAVFHLHLLNVQTGSMRPTFRPHDGLIMQHASASQLQPGMVVSYKSARNPNELVTHRVIRIIPQTQSFQTQGDALAMPDPTVRGSLLVGRVVVVLPGLGSVLGWLQSWWGLAVCVYAPAAAIIFGELRRLERHYARQNPYRLPERWILATILET